MNHYHYTAVTREGHTHTGTLDAPSEHDAERLLLEQGLLVTRLRRQSTMPAASLARRFRVWLAERSVSPLDMILFTKQFNTLFNAGVPLAELLRILHNQTEHPTLKRISLDIAQRVNTGSSLHQAFAAYPRVFSPLYRTLLFAGEQSGALGEALSKLIVLQEQEYRLVKTLDAALRYPKLVLLALIVAFAVLLDQVVPSFVPLFRQAGLALPLPTRMLLALHEGFRTGFPFLVGLLATSVAVGLWWRRTPQGAWWMDRLLFALPVVGKLLLQTHMARFCFVFSLLHRSGISMLDILDILAASLDNTVLARECQRLRTRVHNGQGLGASLAASSIFPPLVVGMIGVGEASGNLGRMLQELAQHYDAETTYALESMTARLNPALIVVLAGMVGFFALAIFLPLWDMMQLVH